MEITSKLAKSVGDDIGIDWKKIDLEEFRMGLKVELEHGSKFGDMTNVTKNDLTKTGKIALAHLIEIPDYYTKLKKVEKQESVNEHILESKKLMQLVKILLDEAVSETKK